MSGVVLRMPLRRKSAVIFVTDMMLLRYLVLAMVRGIRL